MELQNLAGLRFGRLLVLGRAPNNGRRTMWFCLCEECGGHTTKLAEVLKRGDAKGCGCLRKYSHLTHGHSKHTREYTAWINAKQRCENPGTVRYASYGGRGIKVCAAWRDSFETFLADMGPCPSGMSLDRIDGDGDYSPQNCRWATTVTQANNKRNNRRLTIEGRTFTVAEAARHFNVPYNRLARRLSLGWDPSDAVR